MNSHYWLFGMPGPTELIIILLIVLLLFGAKRLPEMAKSLGQVIRDFRKTLSGDAEDEEEKKKDEKDSQ